MRPVQPRQDIVGKLEKAGKGIPHCDDCNPWYRRLGGRYRLSGGETLRQEAVEESAFLRVWPYGGFGSRRYAGICGGQLAASCAPLQVVVCLLPLYPAHRR